MKRSEEFLIRKASRLCKELGEVLDELASDLDVNRSQEAKVGQKKYNEEELRAEFEQLRKLAEGNEPLEPEVSKFVEENPKERLKAFVSANSLPIDANASKQVVCSHLVRLLRQSRAIGAPVKPLLKAGQ